VTEVFVGLAVGLPCTALLYAFVVLPATSPQARV